MLLLLLEVMALTVPIIIFIMAMLNSLAELLRFVFLIDIA
jgi:hypothetical protein